MDPGIRQRQLPSSFTFSTVFNTCTTDLLFYGVKYTVVIFGENSSESNLIFDGLDWKWPLGTAKISYVLIKRQQSFCTGTVLEQVQQNNFKKRLYKKSIFLWYESQILIKLLFYRAILCNLTHFSPTHLILVEKFKT